jgi:ferritin-like metal-binding protein YciE
MAANGTLHDAFIHELRDTYDAEQQLIKALKKLSKRASAGALREAFISHRAETEGQVARLEQVFALLGEKVRGKHCKGIAGILDEAKGLASASFDAPTMDACLIAAAQRAEHYEMAAYGTLVAWAHTLGQPQAVGLLQQNLDEEKAADMRLSSLAEAVLNDGAASAAPEQIAPAQVTKGKSKAESKAESKGKSKSKAKAKAKAKRTPQG